MDSSEDQGDDWIDKAYHKEQKHDESHLLKEVLMSALIQTEGEPIFIGEHVAVHAIAVVRIASLRRLRLEMLLMLLAEFRFDLLVVKKSFALASSAEADQEALE